jgi:hypothetical protein
MYTSKIKIYTLSFEIMLYLELDAFQREPPLKRREVIDRELTK